MKLQDVVVVFDRADRPGHASRLAQQIAIMNDAHLSGFCALQMLVPFEIVSPAGLLYPAFSPLQGEPWPSYEQTRTAARELERSFLAEAARNGVRASWQLDEEPLPPRQLTGRARESDIVVLNQPDPDAGGVSLLRLLLEDVLLGCGRPILMVPYAGQFETVGRNILIGWDGSRAATRAIHDSLPLLRDAEQVTLLTIEEPRSARPDDPPPGVGMAEHLARHSLRVTLARSVRAGTISNADIILNHAAETGADLLVVGAYGHSRTREILLGGVTRALVDHATVPVLMSH